MNTAQLQAVLDTAVAEDDVPFAVGMTGNAAGTTWSGAAGQAAPGRAAGEDTVFRIFSMTKAVGSLAAMILIDRGRLQFDSAVSDILPAFADIKVLDHFEGDTPILRAPETTATVRHLATHTSGFVYEFWNHDLPRYMELTGHPTILSGLKSSLMYPLAFDPGSKWDYGIGIDWLGQVVEAVDGRTIDVFCREEIFEPLGMSSTAFEPEGPLADRLAAVKIRNEAGAFEDFALAPPPHPEFYGMGHALYSTAPDYLRFLRMFLNGGELDGARILSEDGAASMLENHIGVLRIGKMVSTAPAITADVDFYPDIDKTHSFGFMRVEADIPGRRHKGSQTWAGVCNTHYWFDPASDVAGLIMTQSLPFIEPRFLKTYDAFEAAVYAG